MDNAGHRNASDLMCGIRFTMMGTECLNYEAEADGWSLTTICMCLFLMCSFLMFTAGSESSVLLLGLNLTLSGRGREIFYHLQCFLPIGRNAIRKHDTVIILHAQSTAVQVPFLHIQGLEYAF